MAPLYSSGYRKVSAMRMPWPWTDSQSRESRRVIPAGKNGSGLGTAPGSASTKNRVLFALGSRRRNCRSGSQPIQRSRGPHLNAPPCQPASASHRPRQVATQRRPRAAKRRKPGQWCLSTIASQRRRSVGLASRISTSASRRSPGAARQTGWASIHVRICLSMPRCGGFRVKPPAKNRADSEKNRGSREKSFVKRNRPKMAWDVPAPPLPPFLCMNIHPHRN